MSGNIYTAPDARPCGRCGYMFGMAPDVGQLRAELDELARLAEEWRGRLATMCGRVMLAEEERDRFRTQLLDARRERDGLADLREASRELQGALNRAQDDLAALSERNDRLVAQVALARKLLERAAPNPISRASLLEQLEAAGQ